MVYKSSKIINLAIGPFIVLLAYTAWSFMVQFGLPVWLAIILCLACGAVCGVLTERLALRRLLGESIMAILILTLVLGYFINGCVALIWQQKTAVFPAFIPKESANLGSFIVSQHYLWAFGITVLVFVAFAWYFRYTKLGLAMRAVAEDHQIARSVAINVRNIISSSWAIGLVIAAIAGILLGSFASVTPSIGELGLMKALPILLLGGLESLPGALIGGIVVGIAETLGGFYIDPLVGGGFKDIVPLILMLLILIFRPYGIFGLEEIERV